MSSVSVGERISELRKAQNMSQGQLAQAMDVSRQAVSKWENDLASPDSLKMIRLADLLDTDIEYLTTGRRNYGRRPPVVLHSVETVEKVVEKPVVQVVEKVVERVIEKPIEKRFTLRNRLSKKFSGPDISRIRLSFLQLALSAFFWGFWSDFFFEETDFACKTNSEACCPPLSPFSAD